jgi:3'5'-cyclic nucleotide phosphodiesterase
MSVVKLLGRIAHGSEDRGGSQSCEGQHSFYFDPLIQLGCVLSALIHDVDHQGVPNQQLVREALPLASQYQNKTVAEQNSIDIGWALFMGDEYAQFRQTICPSEHHLQRLRQVVVNSVIATDISDEELKQDRNSRWEKAFQKQPSSLQVTPDAPHNIDRRATLVLEHMIQASDISHCMQHWQVYRKWNERLFQEIYDAYVTGRGDADPAEFWYQGELGFFDCYVIPLAMRLRDCEVFGVSSDEFLNYAKQNREEWERRGQETVLQMTHRARQQYLTAE